MRKALLLLALSSAFALSQSVPQGQGSKVNTTIADISTILMQTTFRLEGPSKSEPGRVSIGTVFIMGKPVTTRPDTLAFVLVTAAHVLDDVQGPSASLLVRRKDSDGGFVPYLIPLVIRTTDGKNLYTKHIEADVAAMFVTMPNDLIVDIVSTTYLADDKTIQDLEIHPGDELMCVGFPYGLAVNDWGFPILRTGVISSYPLIPAKKVKFISFDFRVFGGNSGGPVYYRFSNRYYQGTTHLGMITQSIIGLVTEQVSDPTTKAAISLAHIVPAQFISETLGMLGEYTGK
jgi:S1-C subfamily serine protease